MKNLMHRVAACLAIGMVACGGGGKGSGDAGIADAGTVDAASLDAQTQAVDLGQADRPWIIEITYAGLDWSSKSATAVNWQDAQAYCSSLGGRLPTIDELRKIIINCPGSTYGGACPISDPDHLSNTEWGSDCTCDINDDVTVFSAIGDSKSIALWSSSSGSVHDAWAVHFHHAILYLGDKTNDYYGQCFARCLPSY